jgi:deoxycytidine triphosphate deaminase
MSDFEEKWLWLDPFTLEEGLRGRIQPGAVLLAEDIIRYVDRELIFSRKDFNPDNLKGASYSMTPDPDGAWRWVSDKDGDAAYEEGAMQEKLLEQKSDPRGTYFLVPANSFVFIRIKERLRVPYYLIGRHNLKIKYAYQGLLLGTGPQVDPGFSEHLYIPLHNLTATDVRVYLNESFVSIDFVRTTALDLEGKAPENIGEFYRLFAAKKHLLKHEKLQRKRLTDYLDGHRPTSSLHHAWKRFADTHRAITELKKRVDSESDKIVSQQSGFAQDFSSKAEARFTKVENNVQAVSDRTETRIGRHESLISSQIAEIQKRSKIDYWALAIGAVGIIVTVASFYFAGITLVRDVYGDYKKLTSLQAELKEAQEVNKTELDRLRNEMNALRLDRDKGGNESRQSAQNISDASPAVAYQPKRGDLLVMPIEKSNDPKVETEKPASHDEPMQLPTDKTNPEVSAPADTDTKQKL